MANHVPPFFLCPISHDIMNDPVTISSGITFDRDSIQKWLVFYNKNTCPITKQPLPDKLLTPNSNLLRLIQSWQLISNSIPDSDKLDISRLVDEFNGGSDSVRMKLMAKMKILIGENDCFRNFVVDAGVDAAIVSSLVDGVRNLDSEICSSGGAELEYVEEAVSFLCCLKIPKQKLKILSQHQNWGFVDSLSILLIQRTITTRAKSGIVSLLKSIFRAIHDLHRIKLRPELFDGILEILKDQNSGGGSTAAALSALVQTLRDENNRRKAVEAGFVPVLIELLSESVERRPCEQILLVLESLCKVGGGRAAVLEHPAGVAAVSSKILWVSEVANDRAVSVVLSLFRYCRAGRVAWELMEVGGVAKMCMVTQSQCRAHIKDMAREILGFYLKSSADYPCLPTGFIL